MKNNLKRSKNYEDYGTTKNMGRTHKTKAVGALEGTDKVGWEADRDASHENAK
jgi:hypothetical protein